MESNAMPVVAENKEMHKLSEVKPGMDVFDNVGKKVGKVDDVYGGGGDYAASAVVVTSQPAIATVSQPAALPVIEVPVGGQHVPEFDVLGHDDDLPREVHERLLHDGFIRVDAGLFRHHRYAFSGQIAQVAGDRVTLTVGIDELVKH